MMEPGGGTRPSWKERVRLVLDLARWEAAATLSSRGLWMARHYIPGLLVSAFLVHILLEGWDSTREVRTREPAAILGRWLVYAGAGFVAIGIPVLVYARFREALRTGMLEALVASPMSRAGVLLHQVLGPLWAGAHCLLAAAPVVALTWVTGAYTEGGMTRALIAVPAAGCCAAGFATLLAVRGASFEGFLLRYALCLVFAPASMRRRIWIPCALLYLWLGAYSPFIGYRWSFSDLQEAAFGLGMPLQALASSFDAESSRSMFAWGVCGALLWSGLTVGLALRVFPSGTLSRTPAPVPRPSEMSGLPVQHQDLVYKLELSLLRHVYLFSGRNPLVWLLLARHREGSLELASSAWAILGLLLISPLFLGAMRPELVRVFSEALLMLYALLICRRTASLLGSGTPSVPGEILSSPLGGRDIVVGAAVACIGIWPAPFFVIVIRALSHGLAAFPCYMIWTAGALLLAMAVGVWISPVRGGTREKTLVGFSIFIGIYWGASALATRLPGDPVRCLGLGAGFQAVAFALLAVFPSFYRSLSRAAVSSDP